MEDITASKDKEWASKLKKMEKTIKATDKSKYKVETEALVKDILSRKDMEKEVTSESVHSSAPLRNTQSKILLSCYISHRPPSKILLQLRKTKSGHLN